MAFLFKESIIAGFSDFWSRKIRSLVTVVGIILGTMSIIVVLSLVKSINKQTISWMMERGGLSKITVRKDWSYEAKTTVKDYFSWREVEQIRSLIPEAEYFNIQNRQRGYISYEDKSYRTSTFGVLPDFAPIEEWTADKGRFISKFDVDQSNDVIVLGTTVKRELFGNKDAIGKYVTVQGRRLQVIGIMQHRYMKGNNAFRENALEYLNRRTYIPITTMIHKVTGQDNFQNFTIKAKDPQTAVKLAKKVEAIILNMRNGEPVFRIESAQEEADEVQSETETFRMIFFLISMISLLVGGIVIMNIMMATIQERTREIGIRITVGARRIDIFLQFLVQTVLVTVIGGLLGVILGVSILDIVGNYLEMELEAGIDMIFIAIAVSAGVGLVFGISPAIKASKLDPVEALHYE
ncbi:MAG: ABC transporter permease [Candidatus Cloacimonadota bacterium]|nr:ABC transporter permease [Candidatus Cloacimonadota bacterium]